MSTGDNIAAVRYDRRDSNVDDWRRALPRYSDERTQPSWMNSATLWSLSALVTSICAWRYNEMRSQTARDDLVADIVKAMRSQRLN